MVLIVIEAVPAGIKSPAADDSMRTSTGGECGFGASAPSLIRVTDAFLESQKRFGYFAKAGQTRRVVIDPGKRIIPVLRSIYCNALRALASLHVCFFVCLRGKAWLLSLKLKSCSMLLCVLLLRVFGSFLIEVACPSIEAFVQFFYSYSKYFRHRESTILVIIVRNETLASRDSVALVPWYLRVNLEIKDASSVIKYPRHRKGEEA